LNNKLLVYIPSYNRAESLLKQLSVLSGSVKGELFDVVVSDNCSTDDRGYDAVRSFCGQNGFEYKRNLVNVGADANIFNGFMLSFSYKYLWILSDDDLLRSGSIDEILLLLENDLAVLFLTHSRVNSLQVFDWGQKELLQKNIYASDGAGLISNVIYGVDFIKDSIPIGLQNIYTCFSHLSVLLNSFKSKRATIGTMGSHLFFIPDTNLPPYSSAAYSKSYFGFVLLGETLDDNLKKEFINRYASFWNLRHWSIKQKDAISFPNSMYAKCYILKYSYTWNFVRAKLFFWKIAAPVLQYAKSKLSKEIREAVRKKLRIRF